MKFLINIFTTNQQGKIETTIDQRVFDKETKCLMKFQKCRQLGIYYEDCYTVTDKFLDQNFTEIPLRHERNNNRTAYFDFEIETKHLMNYQIMHKTWACSIKLLTMQLITGHSKC